MRYLTDFCIFVYLPNFVIKFTVVGKLGTVVNRDKIYQSCDFIKYNLNISLVLSPYHVYDS